MDTVLKRFFTYQFPVILWGIVILIVSSIPRLVQPFPSITFADKLAHTAEYGIFAYLMSRALFFTTTFQFRLVRVLLLTFIFCAIFGAGDEIHQLFIPGRTESISDFIADLTGSILVLIVFYLRYNRQNVILSEKIKV